MRTQQQRVIEVKRIVHGPGRMVYRNIQGLKVMVIILYLGTLNDFETKLEKQGFNLLQGQGDGVQAARQIAAARQCNINTFRGKARFQLCLL